MCKFHTSQLTPKGTFIGNGKCGVDDVGVITGVPNGVNGAVAISLVGTRCGIYTFC